MANDQRKEPETVCIGKRLVIVLVKWRYGFFTQLENLKKSSDVAFIGYFAEQLQGKIDGELLRHFDYIDWFKADYNNFSSLYQNTNAVEIPTLSIFLKNLIKIMGRSKIRILETEEFLIDTLCKERELLKIPGPTTSDLQSIRDKAMLKQKAMENGIPTAKFFIMNFKQMATISSAQSIDQIEQTIGVNSYPWHYKPVSGCGCGGGGKIKDSGKLMHWITSNVTSKTETVYLIEENLTGIEFWVNICLLQDGSWRPINISFFDYGKTAYGEPMPIIARRLEDVPEQFPKISDFIETVLHTFQPPHPHLFCIQGFQVDIICGYLAFVQITPNSSDYKLTELAYRISGARGTGISYHSSGISQETALLSCHSDPNYTTEPDENWQRIPYATLWYAKRKGKLTEHNALPTKRETQSDIQVRWLAEIGTKMEDAKSYADFLVYFTFRHPERPVMLNDLEYVSKNWRPAIRSD